MQFKIFVDGRLWQEWADKTEEFQPAVEKIALRLLQLGKIQVEVYKITDTVERIM